MTDIFLEAVKKCKGKVYSDKDFLPNKESLINNWDDPDGEI